MEAQAEDELDEEAQVVQLVISDLEEGHLRDERLKELQSVLSWMSSTWVWCS
jgi:hypothetical protein